ncbi:MAG TPA: DUF3857 domain-containing protein [Thermoanaerobaculia bacterium]|nr:DUF3857 domain-containing protein [Thermoanaerobaculia bacterium]
MTSPSGRVMRAAAFPFVLAILLSVPASTALADADPWDGEPLAGDPKAILEAAQKIPSEEAGSVVLLDEDRYVFDAQGRATITRRLLVKIVNESAVDQWSTVQALWAPWYQERPVIQARVITKDGDVRVLEPSAISEAATPEEALDIFSDNRVLRGPLPAIAPGAILEELVTYKENNSLYDAGTSGRYYYGRQIPVHQSRLVLDAPSSLSLRIVNRSSPEIQPIRTQADGRQRLVFESGALKALDHFEWNLPYDTSNRPYVAFSTGKSWQEIAKRYSEIVDKQIGDTSSLAAMVKDNVGTTTDRKQIVERLLAAIEKDIRYAGVEIGESSIVPRTPQEVLSHKYGDCKDKATLLVALLRQAGITAHVVLLRAGEDFDVNAELPGAGQFNHAIVYVDGKPPIWVDPTDEFARAGEMPVPDQGRLALIASPSTTALTQVPMVEAGANRTTETRIFTLSEEGKPSVTEKTEATGAVESNQRRYYAQSDRKKYREAMENYVKGHYAAKALKSLDASDPHDLSKPFNLTLEITEAGRGNTDDGEAAVALFTSGLVGELPYALQPGPENDDDQSESGKAAAARRKRVHDFVFTVPFVREWKYQIIPPPGYVARPLPQNEVQKAGTATLTKEFATAPDGSVSAMLRFDTGKRRLTPSELEEMRKSIKEIRDSKPIIIGFDEIGQLRLNEGDVGAALGEFRKLAALHPAEARHHVEIARALLVGGMGDAARTEVRKAIEIEPTAARAYQTLGIILQHDLLGRAYRKGFDLPGAIAALRKAKELDPKSLPIRADLAKVLEYGDDGMIFGKNAHIDEAIVELDAIEKDLKEDGFQGEVLLAMAHAGRFKEIRDRARDVKDTERRDMGRILAAAALDGSQAALREASSLDQQTRRKLLDAAGGLLVTLRLYSQAADLLEAGAQGTPKMTELREQIEMLRKAKRIETISMPENDPKTAVRKLLVEVMTTTDRPKIAAHFASDEQKFLTKQEDPDGEDDDTADHTATTIRLIATKQSMPLVFYADLGVSGMELLQEGDDKTGYRIRTRNAGEGGLQDETFYVIKEKGNYVVSATNRLPGLIGWSVLRLADAGALDAAKQWLNWARDEITAGGGDDALAGPPFAKLWAKATTSATVDEIRVAAASLMFNRDIADRAIPILMKARANASEEVKARIDSALILNYASRQQWSEIIEPGRRLAKTYPDSSLAFDLLTLALTETGKRPEVETMAKERLARLPKDRDAYRAMARAALRDGDYATSDKYYRQIVDELEPTSNDYNNLAWNALFINRSLDRALADARRANSMPGSTPASLHTLAAIYAETGKSIEARNTLLQSMDDAGREEPASHDWYVLGRIAENYGSKDAALAAYKHVDKPKTSINDSTYLLAQRRVEVLAKKQ